MGAVFGKKEKKKKAKASVAEGGELPEVPKEPKVVKRNAKKEWAHKLKVVSKAFVGVNSGWMHSGIAPETIFDAIYDDKGARKLVKINREQQLVVGVDEDAVNNAIYKHVESTLTTVHKDFDSASPQDIIHMQKFIRIMAPGIDQNTILPIAEKSTPGLTYERLAYDLNVDGPTPTWDSILVRCSNEKALRAFFGSIFDPKADRSQFIYIYGEGNEGKGSMIEALSQGLGSAHIGMVAQKDTTWFAGTVYDKRLVTFGECDDFKYAMSEHIKAITGNDTTTINQKFAPLFKAKALCKFMFASNTKPRVFNTPAHKRRLIYSEIQPWTGKAIPVKVFVAKLVEELPAFLSSCKKIYDQVCPEGGVIPTDELVFINLMEENDHELEDIVDEFFIVDPRLHCKMKDIESIFNQKNLKPKLIPVFKAYLRSRSIKYDSKKVYLSRSDRDPTSKKALWGIAPKPTDLIRVEQYPGGNTDEYLEQWYAMLKKHKFISGEPKPISRIGAGAGRDF